MEIEELMIKMGFNGEPVKQGFLETQIEAKGLKETFEHSFISAGTATKAFKGLLHELADVSPLAGAAMAISLDPVSGLLQTATKAFKFFFDELHAWNEQMDAEAERLARPYVNLAAVIKDTGGKFQSVFDSQVRADKDAERKENERARSERVTTDIAAAEAEHGRDTPEFLARRKEIEQVAAQEARDMEAIHDAMLKQAEAQDLNYTRIEKIQKLTSEQKEAQYQIAEITKAIDKESKSHFPDAEHMVQLGEERLKWITREAQASRDLAQAKRTEKDIEESIVRLRKEKAADSANAAKYDAAIANEQAALENLNAKKRRDNLKDQIALAKAAAGDDDVRFLQEKLHLEEMALLAAQKTGKKQEERDLTDQILLTTRQLQAAEGRRVEMQTQFNYELSKAKEQRTEAVNSQYRPTLDQVAQSNAWHSQTDRWGRPLVPGDMHETSEEWSTRSLRDTERMMGDSYLEAHADQARDFTALEERAKILFRMEGPNSPEYLKTTQQIENLHDQLHDAGILKEDPLKSIDEHIRKLVTRAEKEGLVIQPKNGA